MVKHRLRESIKSLFRSHIGPEKGEQLKGARREIQDKVKRILKLVKDERLEEDGAPLELSEKESLVKLIEDFHNQYQSLHAKYDHLTDELRKKIIGKREQGSSSSSSDSDSDYSTIDDNSKSSNFKNEFQKIIDDLKQELQKAHVEVAELDRRLIITCEEKEGLNSRYLAALSNIHASDKIIMDLKANAEALGIQRSELVEENVELRKQLTVAVKMEAELKQRLEDLMRETNKLILEKETTFLRVVGGQKITDTLRTIAGQRKDEKISVQKELEAVTGELSFLKQQMEYAELQKTDLSNNLKVSEEENESMKLRILQLSNEVQMADNRIEEQIAESNQLREELHDRERQISALSQMQEEYENESSNQIKALEFQITNLKLELQSFQSWKRDQTNVLQQEVQSLQNQKWDMEVQLEEKVRENSGYVIQIQTLKEEVDSITLEQKRLWEDKENSVMQIRNLESEMTEASAQIMAFTAQVDNLRKELLSLQKEKEDQKRGFEEKGNEIGTLLEKVCILEFELRLSNEKLRVTEQLLSEQGESFRERVEKFQRNQRSLEDKIATLSATIVAKGDAYQEIVTDIKESVNKLMTGMENVVCKFSVEYKHYENCMSSISHELQIAKNYVREMNEEKERLKKDIRHLVEQLHDKNKNEEELVLRKTVQMLEEKASKVELDKKTLSTTVVQLQKTVGQLEKLMREKDEGILDMVEEKKEAIRQLCLGIDYHRSRYNYLKDVLSMSCRGQGAR